ncbi:MAG TPA: hypothetical protein VFK84_06385 [Burkholderiales bacterium]|nr:hypothetical protein [Burkholderiales bacterium]
MEQSFRSFCRNADGSWTCIAPATLFHPQGRIQVAPGTCFYPGTVFMGVDLAAWLDAQAADAGGVRSSQSVAR